jgi:hypothetical protein
MAAPVIRIDAIKYARHERTAVNNFARPVDDHDLPMPLDYFVWAIHARWGATDHRRHRIRRGCRRRSRPYHHAPGQRRVARRGNRSPVGRGRDPDHLHYDHAGSLSTFPNARFHVQDAEMAFATGRQVCDREVRAPFDGEPVAQLVRKLYADHVVFHDGDEEFAAGVTLHLVQRAHGRSAGDRV